MRDSLRLQLQRLAMRLAELDEHLSDPTLAATLKRTAEASMMAFDRVLLERYRHVFQGLMAA